MQLSRGLFMQLFKDAPETTAVIPIPSLTVWPMPGVATEAAPSPSRSPPPPPRVVHGAFYSDAPIRNGGARRTLCIVP